MSEEKNPAYRMYGLYKHMFDQHGLVLVEDELNQIIRVVCSIKEIECRQAAEIARLLAVEAAAKDAINQCFCIAPENTIKCECCKAEAETLKDFPHKPTCPVLVINP